MMQRFNTYLFLLFAFGIGILQKSNAQIIVSSGTDTICPNEIITLEAPLSPDGYYLWSPGSEITQTISVSPNSTKEYTVIIDSIAKLEFSKTINAWPFLTLNSFNYSSFTCTPSTIPISVSVSGNIDRVYLKQHGIDMKFDIVNDTVDLSLAILSNGIFSFDIIAEGKCGSSTSTPHQIEFLSPSTINLIGANAQYECSNEIEIEYRIRGNVTMVANFGDGSIPEIYLIEIDSTLLIKHQYLDQLQHYFTLEGFDNKCPSEPIITTEFSVNDIAKKPHPLQILPIPQYKDCNSGISFELALLPNTTESLDDFDFHWTIESENDSFPNIIKPTIQQNSVGEYKVELTAVSLDSKYKCHPVQTITSSFSVVQSDIDLQYLVDDLYIDPCNLQIEIPLLLKGEGEIFVEFGDGVVSNSELHSDDTIKFQHIFVTPKIYETKIFYRENGCSNFDFFDIYLNFNQDVIGTRKIRSLSICDSAVIECSFQPDFRLKDYSIWHPKRDTTYQLEDTIHLTYPSSTVDSIAFIYTSEDESICIKSDTIFTTINAEVSKSPTLQLLDNKVISQGESIQVTAMTDAISIEWSSVDLTTIDDVNNSSPMVSPLVTTTYFVNVENIDGCQKVDSTVVQVIDKESLRLSGTLRIGSAPVEGTVLLLIMKDGFFIPIESIQTTDGSFLFTDLLPGTYSFLGIPSYQYRDTHLPTYSYLKSSWNHSRSFKITNSSIIGIDLPFLEFQNTTISGASISGNIEQLTTTCNDEFIDIQQTEFPILLFNQNDELIDFTFSSTGSFFFDHVPTGNYYLQYGLQKFINYSPLFYHENNKFLELQFTYQCSPEVFTSLSKQSSIQVAPTSFTTYIRVFTTKEEVIDFEFYDATSKLVLKKQQTISGVGTINGLETLARGSYLLKIQAQKSSPIVRKLIKIDR